MELFALTLVKYFYEIQNVIKGIVTIITYKLTNIYR